jgi:hypothetical protein
MAVAITASGGLVILLGHRQEAPGSASLRRCRSLGVFGAVQVEPDGCPDQHRPNTRNMKEKKSSSAAPTEMKTARTIKANTIPNVSAFC